MSLAHLLGAVRIIPVITVTEERHATPLALALRNGGLPIIEVTLRTSASLASIARIANEVPDVVLGAGTVTTSGQLESARLAGAQFIVSPGYSSGLAAAANEAGCPFLPGVATASEIMRAIDDGLNVLKFFPAETSGGVAAIKAFSGPFPEVAFCPTGGINLEKAREYLSLPNVLGVGGSWMAPRNLVATENWSEIMSRTRLASRKLQPARPIDRL